MPTAKTLRTGPVLAIVLTSYTMIVLDISIVITALPKIHRALDFSPTALSWVQNAYLLAFGGLLLLGARAGDLVGRRRMFIIGLGLFTVASVAVGTAQSEAWLIAARAIQGAGAAILAPSTLALLQTSFEEGPERTRAAVDVRGEGRQRLYRLNGHALKPIHDWVKSYERSWSERFERLDAVLEDLKRKEQGDGGDE